MERERTAPAGEELSREDRAGIARVARLPQLVDALADASVDDRIELATALNELLIAMRAPGQEAAESAVVQAALGARKLHGVVDSKGRSCRREAVETLLATGFPHALEVSPEDLAFARSFDSKDGAPAAEKPASAAGPAGEWQKQMSVRRSSAAVLASLGAAGTAFWNLGLVFTGEVNAFHGASTLLAIVSAWVTIAFSRRPTDNRDQGSFGTVLVLTGLFQVLCAFAIGWPAVPALSGAMLAIATLFVGEYDEQGDGSGWPKY